MDVERQKVSQEAGWRIQGRCIGWISRSIWMVGDGGVLLRDTFLFYFSGHGATKGDKSFLLATNNDTTIPQYTGIECDSAGEG